MDQIIVSVPTYKVRPNPYQPESRANPPEEVCETFGKSILKHGMILTPVARPADDGNYEMGDGWLRLQGYVWLQNHGHAGYDEIRVAERVLTNQEMADLVIEANTIRKDLNPIEEASLYKRYVDEFGVSESKLAKEHNKTQGAISNTIRLLQLPEDIQEKVKSGLLPGTHARQLLRMSNSPKLQADMVKRCLEQNFTVNQLSDSIERTLWNNSQTLNPKSDGWQKILFDVSECEGCEHKTRASEPWGGNKKQDRCLNTDCWEKKNAAAIEAKVKAAKEELKKSGATENILTSDDLSYNQYERLDTDVLRQLDNPAECKKCEKKALFKHHIEDDRKPWTVCLDPSCMRRKKTKKTKDDNKVKKEQDRELTVKLGEQFQHVHENPKNCLLVLARHALPSVDAQGKMDLCSMFELPKLSNGRLNMDALIASLPEKSLDELLQLTVAATITRNRRAMEYQSYSTAINGELKKDMAFLTNKIEEYKAEILAFQEAQCRGCDYADEWKIGTDEECCRNNAWARRVGEDGKCQGRIKRHQVPKETPVGAE